MTFDMRLRGRRVPWIARWSGEVATEPFQAYMDDEGMIAVRYADETPEDRWNGILVQRDGVLMHGEPDFGAMNTKRQFRAMLEGLCQVCGDPADGNWLITFPERLSQGLVTTTPPTCQSCQAESLIQCPHLRRWNGAAIHVKDYRPIGVFGDTVARTGGTLQHVQTDIRLDQPQVRAVLARQLAVELSDWHRVKL